MTSRIRVRAGVGRDRHAPQEQRAGSESAQADFVAAGHSGAIQSPALAPHGTQVEATG